MMVFYMRSLKSMRFSFILYMIQIMVMVAKPVLCKMYVYKRLGMLLSTEM